jgi:hypothetical protein
MVEDVAEARDLRRVQVREPPTETRRRIGDRASQGTSRTAEPRNPRRVRAKEPPTHEVSKDPQPGGGSKPPTGWSPRQGARVGYEMRNYSSDLESVDCNWRICWDIPPPSWGIFVNVIRSVSEPYIRGDAVIDKKRESIHCVHLLLSPLSVCAQTSHDTEWESSRSTVLRGGGVLRAFSQQAPSSWPAHARHEGAAWH